MSRPWRSAARKKQRQDPYWKSWRGILDGNRMSCATHRHQSRTVENEEWRDDKQVNPLAGISCGGGLSHESIQLQPREVHGHSKAILSEQEQDFDCSSTASTVACTEFESPVRDVDSLSHADDPHHPEIPDTLPARDDELDSVIGSETNRRDSTSPISFSRNIHDLFHEIQSEKEQDFNCCSTASTLVCPELKDQDRDANSPIFAEILDDTETIDPLTYGDYDWDPAAGSESNRRYSISPITSSDIELVEKHGCTYQTSSYGAGYWLAIEEREERQHHFFVKLLGGLHVAQLPTSVHNVLDLGTGIGIWAEDFGRQHSKAAVLGVDTSYIQKEFGSPNTQFEIFDLSKPWDFEFKFDFIHNRMLFCTSLDLQHIARQSYAALQLGRLYESQNVDWVFESEHRSLDGTALAEWAQDIRVAYGSQGIDLARASTHVNDLKIAGFVDVQRTTSSLDMHDGTEMHDETEKYNETLSEDPRSIMFDMVPAISLVSLTEYGDKSLDAVQIQLIGVRQDLSDPSLQPYLTVIVVSGRKPDLLL